MGLMDKNGHIGCLMYDLKKLKKSVKKMKKN